MAAGKKRRRDPVRESDVAGLGYLRQLGPLLARLRSDGTERDTAGNRQLHYDQYCGLILLSLFNPIIGSLRGIQQASELRKVQKKLGCPRSSLGSLSEAARIFDPVRLREIVAELIEKLPTPEAHDRRLRDLTQTLTAVDGTLLKMLPQITQACYGKATDRGWRLHAQFEVLKGVPVRMDLTDASGSKAAGEKAVLKSTLQPDRCYVLDRGYEQFSLFNAIAEAGSSYVCRVRNDHHFTAEDVRDLSEDAKKVGVLEDAVGRLGSEKSKRIEHPNHVVRRIAIKVTPHEKRGGRKRQAATHDLVIATNLLNVPAEVVALIYRYRWTVKLFFRFFKHVLGCRHLLSKSSNGIEIQTYCAIIACLLIALATGRKPNLRTYEMICHYFNGLAEEDELLAHLNRLPKQQTPSL